VGSRGYEVGLWPNIKFDIIRAQAASPVSASPADLWQEQINVGREKRRSATSRSAAPALSEAKPLLHLQQGREIRVASLTSRGSGRAPLRRQADCPPKKNLSTYPHVLSYRQLSSELAMQADPTGTQGASADAEAGTRFFPCFLHPLIGPVSQPSPGDGVIFTLWTIHGRYGYVLVTLRRGLRT
jgi:hypothetical protein